MAAVDTFCISYEMVQIFVTWNYPNHTASIGFIKIFAFINQSARKPNGYILTNSVHRNNTFFTARGNGVGFNNARFNNISTLRHFIFQKDRLTLFKNKRGIAGQKLFEARCFRSRLLPVRVLLPKEAPLLSLRFPKPVDNITTD